MVWRCLGFVKESGHFSSWETRRATQAAEATQANVRRHERKGSLEQRGASTTLRCPSLRRGHLLDVSLPPPGKVKSLHWNISKLSHITKSRTAPYFLASEIQNTVEHLLCTALWMAHASWGRRRLPEKRVHEQSAQWFACSAPRKVWPTAVQVQRGARLLFVVGILSC